ncbi:MAG: MFS transporter, partial [Proteobacteria bacterium]|nr:MFS transporter [Pseudomonadota bacterium]
MRSFAFYILGIGTFLEYFDLMLYVHMAFLLNDIFFPKTDPYTAQLLGAFSFCITFLFRPIGALIFGYIGDNYGRKKAITITTSMMCMSCFIMANLPTYSEIGIWSAYIVTFCRIIQGISSMGEIIGSEIYFAETEKPPKNWITVSMMHFFAALGASSALFIAYISTHYFFNWRIAFWFGTFIGFIGFFARIKLPETKDFLKAKKQIKTNDIKLIH